MLGGDLIWNWKEWVTKGRRHHGGGIGLRESRVSFKVGCNNWKVVVEKDTKYSMESSSDKERYWWEREHITVIEEVRELA